ncbi:MAG: hypothetical protein LBD23_07935 [Oscillospiraceae bacterium]|jgi:prefoldin subunit 5|nr:hypothetical protein [Oscillospiraceae bacterium]
MSKKDDTALVDELHNNLSAINNKKEECKNTLIQIEHFEKDVTDTRWGNKRDAERIYEFWRGPEAERSLNRIMDESNDNVRELCRRINNVYNEIEHEMKCLDQKHDEIKQELSKIETGKME